MRAIVVLCLVACALSFAASVACAEDLPEWKRAYLPAGETWKTIPQEFVFNNDSEPESLDPGIVTGVQESRLMAALFEGLVGQDPKTLEPRPGMASAWEVSADHLVYTFRLRPDTRWSDGSPLTARDFLDSWQRVLDPASRASYAYQLFPILGAEAFHSGKTTDFATVGATAPDERTLVVRLAYPCAYFLDLVAFPTLAPVPMKLVREFGDRWVRAGTMVSNGPYRLAAWEPRQRIIMERNPHYWDRAFCKLDRVVALPYSDAETAYKLYQQRVIHWLPGLPLAKLDEIKRLADYYVAPYLGVYFYRFNVTKPPFDEVRVRQAFALAIDRRQITEQVLKGGEVPTGAYCPPVSGYKPVTGQVYDRERARSLLKEAGYGPGGKPLPPLEVMFNDSARHKQIAETVVQQWQDVLGAKVSLRTCEWKIYLQDMENLDYQIMRSSWVGDYSDPNTFFDLFVAKGGNNRTGWVNADYDRLLGESQRELDTAKRLGLFQQMERILVERECPIAPVYFYVNQGLLAERVMGWQQNIRDLHFFQYLWLEP